MTISKFFNRSILNSFFWVFLALRKYFFIEKIYLVYCIITSKYWYKNIWLLTTLFLDYYYLIQKIIIKVFIALKSMHKIQKFMPLIHSEENRKQPISTENRYIKQRQYYDHIFSRWSPSQMITFCMRHLWILYLELHDKRYLLNNS